MLNWMKSDHARRFDVALYMVVLAIIVSNMALVWIDAKSSSYVPCLENCGETFHVLKYVKDYKTYGFKYGLIEDLSEDTSPTRKPLLYTHNPNLPGMLFVVMEVVGLKSLAAKQFVILLVHGLGLFYAFIAIRSLTQSPAIAAVFCALLATEYELVFGFALNALRAWHWLALFGLMFHTANAVRAKKPSLHLGRVILFAAIAMGVGYEFFLICFVVSALTAILFSPADISHRGRMIVYLGVVACFLVPLAARQLQILVVMGSDYWTKDIYYSVVSKVSFLKIFVPVPIPSEIEAFYDKAGVYRPPTSSRPIGELLLFARDLLRYVLLPLFGLITLAGFVAFSVVAACVALRRACWEGIPSNYNYRGTIKTFFCLAGGSLIGIALIPDHNLTIFVKHKVPLIAAPILFAKAALIVWFWDLFWGSSSLQRRSMVAAVVAILVIDHVLIQHSNYAAKTPYRFTWIEFLRAHPEATYAVSWDPTAVSAFTGTGSIALSAEDQRELLDGARKEAARSASESKIAGPRGLSLPDYWLYFPTDNMSPYDSFAPECRLDYLSRAVLGILLHPKPAIDPGSNWVRPVPALPGHYVVFGGQLKGNALGDHHELRLITAENLPGRVVTNCHYETFQGWVRTLVGQPDGDYSVNIVDDDSPPVDVGTQIDYRISTTAPAPDFEHPDAIIQLPMLSAEEMIADNPDLPIAARGPGWVIFDLRKFKQAP